jgi:hypothetical protein
VDPITLLVAGAIGLTTGYLANRLSSIAETHKQSAVKVVLLTDTSSRDLPQFVTLCNDLIEPEIRVDAEEMVQWLSQEEVRRCRDTYCPYLLLAKQAGQVIGFLKMILLPQTNYAFIAYIGVDGHRNVQSEASISLVERALKIITEHLGNQASIFCEVQSPTAAVGPAKDRRRARIQRFRSIARQFQTDLFEVDLDIKQPDLAMAGTDEEVFRLLVSFGSKKRLKNDISAEELHLLLESLYDGVYAATFRHDLPTQKRFKAYCERLRDDALSGVVNVRLL